MMKGYKMNEMLKAMQGIPKKMKKVQEGLERKMIEKTSGGGLIKVKVNGKQKVLDIKVDPKVVNTEDIEMLEDLMVVAVNEALESSMKLAEEEMGKVTGGLPPDLKGLM